MAMMIRLARTISSWRSKRMAIRERRNGSGGWLNQRGLLWGGPYEKPEAVYTWRACWMASARSTCSMKAATGCDVITEGSSDDRELGWAVREGEVHGVYVEGTARSSS